MLARRYWVELCQLKRDNYYLDNIVRRDETFNRCVNGFLALVSSSSIGAWAIWREHAFIWMSFVMLSHVVTTLLPFMPYRDRLKSYPPLLADFSQLHIDTEAKWLAVSTTMNESAINKELTEVRSQKHKILLKHLQGKSVVENATMLEEAEELTHRYYAHNFPGDDHEDK